ncbi:hypothetical protein DE146DRAFT_620126, partial [Phaeosphaeria sp. MPI-PUGE-AT-0046c]
YLILPRLNTTYSSLYAIQLFDQHFYPVDDGSDEHRPSEQQDIENYIRRFNDDIPACGAHQTSLSLSEATSMLLPMILRYAAHFKYRHNKSHLPEPRQIPLNTFMDVRPMYKGFAEGFNKCHIRGMTGFEFITGTWTGVYSDYRGFRRSTLSIVIDRSSRGFDAHREFIIEGRILESGVVHMVKRYIVHGWNWTWTGHVTPFGLVGILGSAPNMGGYFWIWKEERGVNQ